MNDYKAIIARNISRLRKERKMTQLDLAERLNYSDKAISKWERGESIPDVTVLIEIAELFSVPLDAIVKENYEVAPSVTTEEDSKLKTATQSIINKNRKAITGISIQAVWLTSLLFFVPISLIFPSNDARWLCFIYAIPVSCIVWLIFNCIWFNRRRNYLIISLLMWSVLISVHVTALFFGSQIHLIYLLGLPGQLIIVLCSAINKNPSKSSKKP